MTNVVGMLVVTSVTLVTNTPKITDPMTAYWWGNEISGVTRRCKVEQHVHYGMILRSTNKWVAYENWNNPTPLGILKTDLGWVDMTVSQKSVTNFSEIKQ